MTGSKACLILLVLGVAHARHEIYERHHLYRVWGYSQQINSLKDSLQILSAKPAAISPTGNLEVLVKLSPEEKEHWLLHFNENGLNYKLVSENLADILRAEDLQIVKANDEADNNRTITWDTYYNSERIYKFVDTIGAKYPDIVTVINAGLSYEGRQIKYVRISTTRFEDLRKPVIIIDALIHANEWVSSPVALYLIEQLVTGTDKELLEQIDWIIIPLVNPDGYEHSIAEDRLWRKTRSKSHEGADRCPGVDGNRNFNFEWGTIPAFADPCHVFYQGPSPFSEPEIRVIRDTVLAHLPRIFLHISLHSYGGMLLYSWGHNATLPSNGLGLHYAALQMATAIDKLKLDKARPYIVGNSALVLYETSGTSQDWTKSVGIPLTFTMELPGYEYDFVVPPTYIKQIVTESWAGIAAGAHHVLDNYL